MKALILLENNQICQVENDGDIFPVADGLEWITCPANCDTTWTYNGSEFAPYVPPPAPIPTAEDNKATAVWLLQQTDWTTIADVGNPQMSNPYLANQADFIAYRNAIRNIAVYPVAGDLVWPVVPTEDWVKV